MSARLWRTSPTRTSRYSASTSVLPVTRFKVSSSWLRVVRSPLATLMTSPMPRVVSAARRFAATTVGAYVQLRGHAVRDVCEAARLLAVAVDGGASAGHQRVNEARDDAGVLRAWVLARA